MLARPIPLQTGIVYGPLKSRRFGISLGVNLLPTTEKICNFNCVYCQYGQSQLTENVTFPTIQEIEAEVATFLNEAKNRNDTLSWMMIAGNGEATLHPDFADIVDCLRSLRDQMFPNLPIGILSNSSTCHQLVIQEALSKLEGRFMKLDAGTKPLFYAVNHPTPAVQWTNIISGLYHLRNIVLQSLFFMGDIQNVSQDLIDDWIVAVNYIKPMGVQIYTIDRPTHNKSLLPVSKKILDSISSRLFEKTGIRSIVFDQLID